MCVNSGRLQRTRMSLTHQQTLFLDALPLLFHYNHPMLPGFVSHSTPAGVSTYKPSKSDHIIGKTLARSFFCVGGYHGDDIWGIFLMGSVGTLAQSSQSDFDVWLCHRPGLSAPALEELKHKCTRIADWAKTLRLDAHFFLMDCNAFVAGEQLSLDEESSGSAQRVLLLDEFYRTALYIAGRMPLWWFVPAEKEGDYEPLSHELLSKRFLRPGTTLDFGSMSHIPAGEFVGAGIWQLYKAVSSPYKSVLKLLLMEAYVHDFPCTAPLSLEYKSQIFTGKLALDELDPYIMVYRRIERYLLDQRDHVRLELVRRCLYFKINKPLSRPHSRGGKSWQRLLLERLTEEWGWSRAYIEVLDKRSHWKALQVKEERNQLVQALNHSYDTLLEFAQRNGATRSISEVELTVLGRKLQAAFDRRPGKLDWINPGISADVSEDTLHFIEARVRDDVQGVQTVWQLCGGESGLDTPLRQTHSPVELLLWCYANRIIDGQPRMDVSRAPSTTESQLKRTLTRLQQWLPLPVAAASHAAFEQGAVTTHVLLLINVGAETQSPLGSEIHRLSDSSDPFCYGGLAENLIASVDMITRNSWQEVTSQRFSGREALLQALRAYMSLCAPGSDQPPPVLELECFGTAHAALISQRCKQWFDEIILCYYSGTKPAATRFLFTMGKKHYSLQFRGVKLVLLEHNSATHLMHYLGESQRRYSPLVIDSYSLLGHPIKLIAKRASARALHVFFSRQGAQLLVQVVDEKGSVIAYTAESTPKLEALHSLHLFLRNVLHTVQQQEDYPLDASFGVHPVEFHEIRADQQGHLVLAGKVVRPDVTALSVQSLQAQVECNSRGQFEYSFHCQDRSFHWVDWHSRVFQATANHLRMNRSTQQLPLFITQLNLEGCKEQLSSSRNLQTSHYLRIKVELEKKLNRVLTEPD